MDAESGGVPLPVGIGLDVGEAVPGERGLRSKAHVSGAVIEALLGGDR